MINYKKQTQHRYHDMYNLTGHKVLEAVYPTVLSFVFASSLSESDYIHVIHIHTVTVNNVGPHTCTHVGHAYGHAYPHTRSRTHTRACTYTHTYTHARACTHTQTHTHTRRQTVTPHAHTCNKQHYLRNTVFFIEFEHHYH
jgi:hypothetical protein